MLLLLLFDRKAHLKETQHRIAELNEKVGVATSTLQQALSGVQARLEDDVNKVSEYSRCAY